MTTNNEDTAPTYTATVKPKGKKWLHTVKRGDEVVATRGTAGLTPYAFCYVVAGTLNTRIAAAKADVAFYRKRGRKASLVEAMAHLKTLEAEAAAPGAEPSKPLGSLRFEYARSRRTTKVTQYGEIVAEVPIATE